MNSTKISVRSLLFFLLVLCVASLSFADAPIVKSGAKVIVASAHDVSPAFRDIPPAPLKAGVLHVVPNLRIPRDLPEGRSGDSPATPSRVVEQDFPGAMAMPATIQNFEGTDAVNSQCGCAPPDTNGTVGPNHYVQIVNTAFAVYSKTGTLAAGFPKAINTLWSGFDPTGPGHNCDVNDDGDPIVVYDQIADRWVISQFSVSSLPYSQCVAVSTSGDPTGTYNRYVFTYGNDTFNDYPKMGVWPDAYYVTYNMFGSTTFTGTVCAMDRTNMLAGNAATQQCFNDAGDGGLLPATQDGPTQPSAGEPEFVMQLETTSSLRLWKFHVDWTTPANSTFASTDIAVSLFAPACNGGTCITQPHSRQRLDSLADRLMYRLAYRNFGSHESLVVNHTIAANPKRPTLNPSIRWYEIQDPNGTPTVAQQGTYKPDKGNRWMGSIAMDKQGNMALGFSLTYPKLVIYPSIRVTGRLATDPAGQMTQGETNVMSGTGSQTPTLNRWGDYSNMAVDPSDDCTFWYTQEYIATNGNFNWKTRIASFKFPSCS